MSMNLIFALVPNGQGLLSLLDTLAPPSSDFPGTPHCFGKSSFKYFGTHHMSL